MNVFVYILPEISYSPQVLLPLIICPRECIVIIESVLHRVCVLHIIVSAVECAIIKCIA